MLSFSFPRFICWTFHKFEREQKISKLGEGCVELNLEEVVLSFVTLQGVDSQNDTFNHEASKVNQMMVFPNIWGVH